MNRILVVEDSPTQAEAARTILEGVGYEVELTYSGEEALEFLMREDCDLIISDIVMPGMSGYELCQTLKANARLRPIPLVLLTTLSDPLDIIQGLEVGADNFVTKPYEADYLVDRVNTLLENRMLRAAGKLKVGVEVMFLGRKFTVTTDREQILDLLITTFEDVVRANRALRTAQSELSAAKAKLEDYAERLEGKVRSSEEMYRALMEQARDAILVFDMEGTIVSANQSADELYALGSPLEGRKLEDLTNLARTRFHRVREERVVSESGVTLPMPDGTERVIDYTASVIRAADEDLILAIIRDVTEQKELERRIHQSQKLEAVARLASGAAHDFNNILMAIQTFSDLLMRQIPTDQDRARTSLDQIRKATRRGAWLTGQLLTFARGNVGGSAEVDVNEVIRNVEPMLEQLLGEGVDLQLSLAGQGMPVPLEAGHVEQIVMNLVVNARDAMPSGGSISITTDVVDLEPLEQPSRSGGPHARIAVHDTGMGMSEEVAERLFDPFFTTKRAGRGSGLGLSIVEAIVTQAGGRIGVKTAPGKGTTFEISFPLVQAQRASDDGPTDGATAKDSGRVLVIHNDASLRSLLHEFLASHGYDVEESIGEVELAAARGGPRPDAIVSEVPGERVRTLLRIEDQDVPIIEVPGLGVSAGLPIDGLDPRAILAELRSRRRRG